MPTLVTLGALFLLPLLALAQVTPIEIRVQASPREVRMGDPIHYDIAIEHSKDIDILEQWPVEKMGPFEILDSTASAKTDISNDKKLLSKSYSLIVFATGEQTIPALNVEYRKGESGDVERIQSAPITISVASLIGAGTPELRDIKPPVGIPTKIGAWVYLLLGMIAVVVLVFLLLAFWKRPKSEVEEPVEPPMPADLWALEQLRQVRYGPALSEKNAKQLALSTSEIIRRYLDRLFGFNTIDLTTEEIVRLLEDSPIGIEVRQSFGEFFSLTDLIKFAKYQPEDGVLIDIVDDAEELVRKTSLVQEAERAQEAQS